MFKFLKENIVFIIYFLLVLPAIFILENPYGFLIKIIILVSIFSLLINMYLSYIFPLIIQSFSEYIYKQSYFKFSIFFSITVLLIWNFSLYIPDKIFNIFTAGLVFIPNVFDGKNKNRLNDIFKILIIYVGIEFLKEFKFNATFGFSNKIKWLLDSTNMALITDKDLLFSIFKAVLYTKFYFLSLRVISDCIKFNNELIELEKKKEE